MNIYKYVELLIPDSYYGGNDEEILFYCNDKNKDNKIRDYLVSVINEKRLLKSKEFFENKKIYNARVFYDLKKNILGLISDQNEYFILEDALRLNEPNFKYFFSNASHGHHQFHLAIRNITTVHYYYTYENLKVSKEKFESYNLPECEYLKGERYFQAKTPLKDPIIFANYNLFEKDILKKLTSLEYDLEIEKIKNNYKLIKIEHV